MGSLFGGTKTKSSSRPEVWEPQQKYMKEVLGESQRLYNADKGTPGYSGDFYAGLNPMQTSTLNNMFGTGGSFAGAGSASLLPGLKNLMAGQNYGDNANAAMTRAAMDPTGKIISDAGQYADNPYMQSMIDAATRDAKRAIYEGALPQLNDSASDSGNAYSSRTGVTEALLRRGLGDTVADTSAALRGDAYRAGLGMGQSQWNQNIANMTAANAGVGNAASLGADLLGKGAGLAGQGYDMQSTAGNAYQQDSQARLDEAQKKFETQDMRDWDVLGRYFNFAGWGGGPGTASSSTTKSKTGLIPTLLGAASGIGGLYNMGWGANGLFRPAAAAMGNG